MRSQPLISEALSLRNLGVDHCSFNHRKRLSRIFTASHLSKNDPLHGLNVIFRHPLTGAIHEPEAELRLSILLLGRLALPVHHLGIVLRHLAAVVIHDPEAEPADAARQWHAGTGLSCWVELGP